MHALAADILTALIVFAATNVDDVLLLVGFFADTRYRASQVVLGQYLGMAALFIASALASMISLVLAPAYIGLLGIVPIALGVRQLMQEADDDDERIGTRESASPIATVTLVTIANGGDNVGVYVPLFATLSASRIALYGTVFAILTACLCWLAWRMVTHPATGAVIRRYAHRFMPLVFVALGILILIEAGTVAHLLQMLRT